MMVFKLDKRHLAVALVTAVLLGVLTFVAFRLGPLSPTKITLTKVKSESITPSVFGIGSVEARQSWLMGPIVAGRVLRVHVDVGQVVKAGQLLAEMDPVDLDQRLHAQEAALYKATSVEIASKAQVADAKARRELAHSNFKRQEELARQQFISTAALEGRNQEFESAEAVYQAALASLQAAKQDTLRLQAERKAVALQMQNTKLLAPADAVVISRDAETGSTVVAGQPVIKLANPATLWVKLRIDQGRSSGLETGLPASIVLRSSPQQMLSGKVERLELQADLVTEERIVQVAFDQIPPSLSIGEMAEVTLNLKPKVGALVVPQASVQTYQGRSGVWRVIDGRLNFAIVQWGAASLDGQIEAVQGLESGDVVVAYSEKALFEGASFRVVDALVKKTNP